MIKKNTILSNTIGVVSVMLLTGCSITITNTPATSTPSVNPIVNGDDSLTGEDDNLQIIDNDDDGENGIGEDEGQNNDEVIDEEAKRRYKQYAKLLNDFFYEKDSGGGYCVNGLVRTLSYEPADSIQNPQYALIDINNDGYVELLVGEGPREIYDGIMFEDSYINVMAPKDKWSDSLIGTIWMFNCDTNKAIVEDFGGLSIGYFEEDKFVTEEYFERNLDHQFDTDDSDELHQIFHYVNGELTEILDDRDNYFGPYMEGFSKIEMKPLNDDAIAEIAKMGE